MTMPTDPYAGATWEAAVNLVRDVLAETPSATDAKAGLMSAADKSRLDGLTPGSLGISVASVAALAAQPARPLAEHLECRRR